jgi:UDP-N-acetylmuramate dehydrogenase
MQSARFDPQLLASYGVSVRQEVPLAPYTTLKVGGPATCFAEARTVSQLIRLVRWARAAELPYLLLGGGSNVLVSDAGVEGLVIYNCCRQTRIDAAPCCVFGDDERPFVFAESGSSMAGLARRAIAAGLTGLEWAVSLPGTVGGAVVNNAGAYGGAVSDNLYNALILGEEDEIAEVPAAQLAYGYRRSRLKQSGERRQAGWILQPGFGPVVLSANFRLAAGHDAGIRAQAEHNLQHRRQSQPVEPSLGSTFVNPPGDFAGRLIEAAGLKEARCGGVQVSQQHANFLINPGGVGAARAADVLALIQTIRQEVAARTGIWLEPEVQLVGSWEIE